MSDEPMFNAGDSNEYPNPGDGPITFGPPPPGAPTVYDVDDAAEATGSTDPAVIAAWLKAHNFKTKDIPAPDFAPGIVDNDDQIVAPGTALSEIKDSSVTKDPATVILENFNAQTYESALAAFQDASDDVDGGRAQAWRNMSQWIKTSVSKFQSDLAAQDHLGDW